MKITSQDFFFLSFSILYLFSGGHLLNASDGLATHKVSSLGVMFGKGSIVKKKKKNQNPFLWSGWGTGAAWAVHEPAALRGGSGLI